MLIMFDKCLKKCTSSLLTEILIMCKFLCNIFNIRWGYEVII
jgi:hypothetical protein